MAATGTKRSYSTRFRAAAIGEDSIYVEAYRNTPHRNKPLTFRWRESLGLNGYERSVDTKRQRLENLI